MSLLRTAAVLAGSLVLAAPALARGSEVNGGVETEVGTGFDTNPDRVLGVSGSTAGFLSALLRGKLKLRAERFAMTAQLAEAGRFYPSATGATALGSRLDATGSYALGRGFALGASLLASDLTERGHQLDQDLLDGVATVSWASGPWQVQGGAGWNLFAPRDTPLRPFLSSGPRTVLGTSWEFSRGELLAVAWDFAAPGYGRWRDLAGSSRDDRTHTFSAELVHRGSFLAAAGYAYTRNRSTAAGGAYDRHRVHARVSTFLAHDVTLAARASLQWSSYPEPLFLSEQILLSDGQQNLNSLEMRLAYPLGDVVDLALSVALYRAEATLGPGESPSFTRAVTSIGIAYRGAWSTLGQ